MHTYVILTKAPLVLKLSGEHAVVYGFRAISCAIDRYVYCKVDNSNREEVILKFRNLEDRYDKKIVNRGFFRYVKQALKTFEEEILGKDIRRLKIELNIDRDVEPGSGLGTSAATIVSVLTGLLKYYNIELSIDEIVRYAHKIERDVQGRASRMDTSTTVYGGLLQILKDRIKKIYIDTRWINMIIVLTRKLKSTEELVNHVAMLYERNRDLVLKIFESIDKCSEYVLRAIYMKDIENLGRILTTCHWLLNCLEVVDKLSNEIVIDLLSTGYFTGAKVSGAGYGGAILAILKKDVDTIVLEDLEVKHNSNAFKILRPVRISNGGVKIYD